MTKVTNQKWNLEQLSDAMLHKLEQEILIIKTTRAMRAEGLLPPKPKTRRTRGKVSKVDSK